jgi:hypothetical protein
MSHQMAQGFMPQLDSDLRCTNFALAASEIAGCLDLGIAGMSQQPTYSALILRRNFFRFELAYFLLLGKR